MQYSKWKKAVIIIIFKDILEFHFLAFAEKEGNSHVYLEILFLVLNVLTTLSLQTKKKVIETLICLFRLLGKFNSQHIGKIFVKIQYIVELSRKSYR